MYLSTKEMDKYISGKTIKCGKNTSGVYEVEAGSLYQSKKFKYKILL